ncbi:hypothetical protein FRC01_000541 [Tulasnella sp. 417]|nr:hypothetical protein FRC01_000541 [Tulasnella sp. 417]
MHEGSGGDGDGVVDIEASWARAGSRVRNGPWKSSISTHIYLTSTSYPDPGQNATYPEPYESKSTRKMNVASRGICDYPIDLYLPPLQGKNAPISTFLIVQSALDIMSFDLAAVPSLRFMM